MKFVIGFATSESRLRDYVAANRNKIVPKEHSSRGYFCEKNIRFSVQIFAVNAGTDIHQIDEWLRRISSDAEGLILLVDDASRHLFGVFEDAYFISSLPVYLGNVSQNQITSAVAPVLRNFAFFSQRFDCLRTQKIALLPLDIFVAAELCEFRQLMTYRKMLPGFATEFDKTIAELSERARPKSRQRFKKTYYVDDRSLWYRYGPERHRVVETTKPPHDEKCWHNSRFRFGRLYDDRLHFNVDTDSEPTSVSGKFMSCHGEMISKSNESHLNVFPNGYL